MKTLYFAVVAAVAPGLTWADGFFGTQEEAHELAQALITIIDDDGIDAAIKAMHDPDHPFVTARMGVNLFQGSTVIADNREPETIAADYSETADLTGTLVWPLITAAADVGGDADLKWYHYDTQEAYDYKCLSMRPTAPNVTVMICR